MIMPFRILVEKIEPGLKIPGLRDSLIQILRDYNLQVINLSSPCDLRGYNLEVIDIFVRISYEMIISS